MTAARRSLALKVAASILFAAAVGVFGAFMAATTPPWSIGVGVGALCVWHLVKAAMDDYDSDCDRRMGHHERHAR